MNVPTEQKSVCDRFDVVPEFPTAGSTLGITLNVREGIQPINGLRHPPENGSNGWYIWSSDTFPTEDDGFNSLHVEHIADWNADIARYLALPPGWRFLIAPGYKDVWFDENLLNVLGIQPV